MSEQLKKLKRAVVVESCLTQSVNGFEPIEIVEEVLGSLYHVDNDTFILAFESEVNGTPQTTTLKLNDDTLSVVRIGDVHSRQTFSQDEWYAHQYFYGGKTMVFRNYTKKLDYALSEAGGVIEVLYELWSGETHLGYYHLEFMIRA
ncbi:MAG: DUF1934 domain-containing protein [Vampirovibrionales bacterium]|nr:DUF1934 domain-containing protein [Vampirovibrionales bacterium]